MEEQLNKAMFNFNNNIEEKKEVKVESSDEEEDEEKEPLVIMNYEQLERREEYLGKDGEMDWRCLTSKEKR
jgi:hypothetical protein